MKVQLLQTLQMRFNHKPFALTLLEETDLLSDGEIVTIIESLDSRFHADAYTLLEKSNRITDAIASELYPHTDQGITIH